HWRAPPPMRLCLLNATRCSILASSHRMSDAGVVRLLLFRVGTLVCAADAERVREILPRLETTRIPGAPPPVAGLVNVRGTLITVVEGWRALRQPEPPASNGTHHGTTVVLEVGGGRKVLGFTVDEVVDLLALRAEALEKDRELKPDLVTMDIGMPDMGGIDAVREIVKQDPDAKILMCSAMGQQALVVEAIQAGAKDFVVKPFQPSRVLEAVQRVLG